MEGVVGTEVESMCPDTVDPGAAYICRQLEDKGVGHGDGRSDR